jgi:hypothetical protein
MELVTVPQNQEVFRWGSVGEKFYFTLQGVVEIQIPDPKRIQEFHNVGKEIDQTIWQQSQVLSLIKDCEKSLAMRLE